MVWRGPIVDHDPSREGVVGRTSTVAADRTMTAHSAMSSGADAGEP